MNNIKLKIIFVYLLIFTAVCYANMLPYQTITDLQQNSDIENLKKNSKFEAARITMDTESLFNLTEAWQSRFGAGRLYGGEIINNGDGTVHINAGCGIVKTVDGQIEEIPTSYDSAAISKNKYICWDTITSLTLTDNAYNYIYYDGAEDTIKATTNFYSISFYRDFTLGRAYRGNGDITVRLCGTNLWNFDRRVQLFGEEVFPVIRGTGLILADAGTRNISISAGVLWAELVNRFSVDAFNSTLATDSFTYWWYDGVSGYNSAPDSSQIDNFYYNNSGTLTELTNNRYSVHWVYVVHDGSVHIVYGTGDYSLANAQLTNPPSQIPGLLNAYASLIGRIIIQKNSPTITEISSAFAKIFSSSAVTNHNDLGGLNSGEYIHLTAAEKVTFDNIVTDTAEWSKIKNIPNMIFPDSNISLLKNDSNFIQAGDNMSLLINDSNFASFVYILEGIESKQQTEKYNSGVGATTEDASFSNPVFDYTNIEGAGGTEDWVYGTVSAGINRYRVELPNDAALSNFLAITSDYFNSNIPDTAIIKGVKINLELKSTVYAGKINELYFFKNDTILTTPIVNDYVLNSVIVTSLSLGSETNALGLTRADIADTFGIAFRTQKTSASTTSFVYFWNYNITIYYQDGKTKTGVIFAGDNISYLVNDSGFITASDITNKADTPHLHNISDVNDLQTALNSKLNTADSGLYTTLAAYADNDTVYNNYQAKGDYMLFSDSIVITKLSELINDSNFIYAYDTIIYNTELLQSSDTYFYYLEISDTSIGIDISSYNIAVEIKDTTTISSAELWTGNFGSEVEAYLLDNSVYRFYSRLRGYAAGDVRIRIFK
jgi:hypothetical protein